MAQKRPGLGKGFGDLFARTDEEAPHEGRLQSEPIGDGSYFAELPLHQVSPNPRQPRSNFDEDELAELAESIREFGVLQPVVVRGVGNEAYELVMGERRFRASRLAGQSTIPAIVRGTGDDALLRDALLENLHRADLNPLEEAAAYQQLLDDFGCTKEELSRRIHRSRPQVSNTLRLLKLPARVQRRVAAGVLSAGHARALLGLPDASAMELLADRIVAEGLSVRSTEEVVALGERGGGRSPSPRVTKAPTERESMVGRRLSDRLDTRVKVQIGKSKGRITIEFSNEDDLERIVAAMENRTL